MSAAPLLLARRGPLSVPTFSPASIAGLVGWWPADKIAGVDDGQVGTWPDQSGLGHDLLQAVTASKPLLKTAIQNGLPIVRFDGVDDLMAAAFALNQPATFFAVASYRSAVFAAPSKTLFDGGVTQFTQLLTRTATGTMTLSAGANLNLAASPNGWHAYCAIFNGVSSSLRADGGAPVSGNGGAGNASGITVGRQATVQSPNQWGDVDVGEILAYNSSLGSTDRQAIEGYLRAKWATP